MRGTQQAILWNASGTTPCPEMGKNKDRKTRLLYNISWILFDLPSVILVVCLWLLFCFPFLIKPVNCGVVLAGRHKELRKALCCPLAAEFSPKHAAAKGLKQYRLLFVSLSGKIGIMFGSWIFRRLKQDLDFMCNLYCSFSIIRLTIILTSETIRLFSSFLWKFQYLHKRTAKMDLAIVSGKQWRQMMNLKDSQEFGKDGNG